MSNERVIIRESALPDLRRSGGRLRASCPVHGSDHQRSLSIQPEGQYAGFGQCFSCGAEVLVEDMNPDAARRLATLGAQPVTPERLLRPIKRYHAEAAAWQQEERAALEALFPRMQAALERSAKARAYLEARCILLEVAQAQGVGYIPPGAAPLPELRPLQKWLDRLIFPLSSPDGRGYAGRSLALWQPGMDEYKHKELLDQPDTPKRWRKSFPAGWYGLAGLTPDCQRVITCEGPFDRLALIAACGDFAGDMVALVGSRDSRAPDWLPARVQHAVVALDGDEQGRAAAEILAQRLPERAYPASPALRPTMTWAKIGASAGVAVSMQQCGQYLMRWIRCQHVLPLNKREPKGKSR